MTVTRGLGITAAAALVFAASHVQAASLPASPAVFLSPAGTTVNLSEGTLTLELFADFTGAPTIGGGIDLAVSGPAEILGFAPSDFYNVLLAGGFTGFGPEQADADFQIHFGSFAGIAGFNKLGDLTLGLLGLGEGAIAININSSFGSFFPVGGLDPQSVDLLGASFTVVPVPAAVWLFGSALGLMALVRRRGRLG